MPGNEAPAATDRGALVDDVIEAAAPAYTPDSQPVGDRVEAFLVAGIDEVRLNQLPIKGLGAVVQDRASHELRRFDVPVRHQRA